MAKAALPYLSNTASLLTLTYLGGVRVVPSYNTMGLAKASLESSVRYLADAVGSQRHSRERHERWRHQDAGGQRHQRLWQVAGHLGCASPLKRNVTIDEVGNVAAFLLSDLASGMTGQITYVDCGVSQTAVAVVDISFLIKTALAPAKYVAMIAIYIT